MENRGGNVQSSQHSSSFKYTKLPQVFGVAARRQESEAR